MLALIGEIFHPARRFSTRHAQVFLGLVLVFVCTALALAPQIDLAIARFFYVDGHFIAATALGRAARMLARTLPFLLLGGLTLAWVVGRIARDMRFVPRGRSLAWLFLSMALGPGLVVDGMKEISHRPRPAQVTEFGGPWAFRPYYLFDGRCPANCAFPSGEAAAAFWTLAPASLAPPPLRPAAIGAALIFGLATSLLRLAFGGHFLSDVVFAGILTAAVVFGLRRMRRFSAAPPPPREPGQLTGRKA